MKPRIRKKLCKRVYQIAGDAYGKPRVTTREDEWCSVIYPYVFAPSTAKEKQWKRNHGCRMGCFLVVGSGVDASGEYMEGDDLFSRAREEMRWTFGKKRVVLDQFGDEHVDWPELTKRLTGKEVIKLLKLHTGETNDE